MATFNNPSFVLTLGVERGEIGPGTPKAGRAFGSDSRGRPGQSETLGSGLLVGVGLPIFQLFLEFQDAGGDNPFA